MLKSDSRGHFALQGLSLNILAKGVRIFRTYLRGLGSALPKFFVFLAKGVHIPQTAYNQQLGKLSHIHRIFHQILCYCAIFNLSWTGHCRRGLLLIDVRGSCQACFLKHTRLTKLGWGHFGLC
jgi:hypothetical protein